MLTTEGLAEESCVLLFCPRGPLFVLLFSHKFTSISFKLIHGQADQTERLQILLDVAFASLCIGGPGVAAIRPAPTATSSVHFDER